MVEILSQSPEEVINVALDTLKIKKQAIIFSSSKASCEKTARELSNFLKKQKQTENMFLSEQILNVLSHPTTQCQKLSDAIKFGIAFHHSGLHYKQRDIIENAFRKGDVKIIIATPTLAAGVSLPAFRTILKDLKRFSGWGMNYIPVLEYMQQAGRAGRPEYDTFGEAIIIAKSEKEKEELHKKYICGVPEEITSKLAVEPILKMYVLSLIATDFVNTEEELLDFFKETFWAKQFGDFFILTQKLYMVIEDLVQYGFVEKTDENTKNIEKEKDSLKTHHHTSIKTTKHSDYFVSAITLTKSKESTTENISNNTKNNTKKEKQLQATLIGSRVSELYLNPDSANHMIISLKKANKDTTDFAYMLMLSLTTELKPQSSLAKKDAVIMEEDLLKKEGTFLNEPVEKEDDFYYEYLNAFKTAFFLNLWADEIREDVLFENYNVRPGELNEKISTIDWLLYASSELTKLSGNKDVITPLNKLRTRIKYGVKEELLPLLQLKGVGRVRARKLFNVGFKTLKELKSKDQNLISQIVGEKLKISILSQLNIPINTSNSENMNLDIFHQKRKS
ncbi:MAG: helicase-related protein [Candidatus Woesearchaeota archaeon]|jgi:helicase